MSSSSVTMSVKNDRKSMTEPFNTNNMHLSGEDSKNAKNYSSINYTYDFGFHNLSNVNIYLVR
jgi:hypothetical protein